MEWQSHHAPRPALFNLFSHDSTQERQKRHKGTAILLSPSSGLLLTFSLLIIPLYFPYSLLAPPLPFRISTSDFLTFIFLIFFLLQLPLLHFLPFLHFILFRVPYSTSVYPSVPLSSPDSFVFYFQVCFSSTSLPNSLFSLLHILQFPLPSVLTRTAARTGPGFVNKAPFVSSSLRHFPTYT